MRSVFALALALAVSLALPLAAQSGSPSEAPSLKGGPLAKLAPDLQRIHRAFEFHAQSRTAAPFQMRTEAGVLVGETVPIEAAAADGDGRALLAELEALGLEGGVAFGVLVNGRLPVAALDEMAGLGALRSASVPYSMAFGPGVARVGAPRPVVRVGEVTGEASRALRADEARSLYGVDGSGVRIGVLSDTYDHCGRRASDTDLNNDCVTRASEDVASGDLPQGGALVVEELAGSTGSDEGRAMMQLAYDVAPGATFAFHTAFGGQASFAQGIIDLADAGANIIVDDVLNLSEPFFQDGVVAQAVDIVVGRGIPYFSSAGNQADDTYESDFVDSGQNASFQLQTNDGGFAPLTGDLHDFNPGPGVDVFQDITLAAGEEVRMSFQYAEPSFSASNGQAGAMSDYDLVLVSTPNTNATPIEQAISNNNLTEEGSGEPYEILAYVNQTGLTQTVYLAIVKYSGQSQFMKYVDFAGQGDFQYAQSGGSTSVAHNNAAGAMGIAAAAWFNTPQFTSLLPQPIVNSFSSYGGGTIRFGPNGARLASPVDRRKPDLLGTDGDNNTFFGGDSGADSETPARPNFFGTSAAAPNVAAVTALMVEASGGPGVRTPEQIYQILEGTADDVTPFALPNGNAYNQDTGPGYDIRSGEGFVRADDAVQVATRPVATAGGPDGRAPSLSAPTPNPAADALTARLDVPVGEVVTVAVFDVLGRRVATVHDGPASGALALHVDAARLAPGLYVLRATGADGSVSRTFTVAR